MSAISSFFGSIPLQIKLITILRACQEQHNEYAVNETRMAQCFYHFNISMEELNDQSIRTRKDLIIFLRKYRIKAFFTTKIWNALLTLENHETAENREIVENHNVNILEQSPTSKQLSKYFLHLECIEFCQAYKQFCDYNAQNRQNYQSLRQFVPHEDLFNLISFCNHYNLKDISSIIINHYCLSNYDNFMESTPFFQEIKALDEKIYFKLQSFIDTFSKFVFYPISNGPRNVLLDANPTVYIQHILSGYNLFKHLNAYEMHSNVQLDILMFPNFWWQLDSQSDCYRAIMKLMNGNNNYNKSQCYQRYELAIANNNNTNNTNITNTYNSNNNSIYSLKLDEENMPKNAENSSLCRMMQTLNSVNKLHDNNNSSNNGLLIASFFKTRECNEMYLYYKDEDDWIGSRVFTCNFPSILFKFFKKECLDSNLNDLNDLKLNATIYDVLQLGVDKYYNAATKYFAPLAMNTFSFNKDDANYEDDDTDINDDDAVNYK